MTTHRMTRAVLTLAALAAGFAEVGSAARPDGSLKTRMAGYYKPAGIPEFEPKAAQKVTPPQSRNDC